MKFQWPFLASSFKQLGAHGQGWLCCIPSLQSYLFGVISAGVQMKVHALQSPQKMGLTSAADQEQTTLQPWTTWRDTAGQRERRMWRKSNFMPLTGAAAKKKAAANTDPWLTDSTGCCRASLREDRMRCLKGSFLGPVLWVTDTLGGDGVQLGKWSGSIAYRISETHVECFSLKQHRRNTQRSQLCRQRNNAGSKVLMWHNFEANSCARVGEVLFFSLCL